MAQYFNLTLDTAAPTGGSASGLQAYYNSAVSVTISASDATFMKVWTNSSASGSTSDSEFPSSWSVYSTSATVTPASQGTNYVHAIFMDNVGNISSVVNSSSYVYDTVAPTISAVSINNGDGYTNHADNNTVRVTFTDATSGVTKITLGGPIEEAGDVTVTADDRTAGYKDVTITFTGEDGSKTVTATATDFAGNTSTQGSDSIVLDTTGAEGTLIIRNADDSANLPEYTSATKYAAAIETEDEDIVSYKIWEGSTEPSSWSTWTGTTRQVETNLDFSSGDGSKTINAKIQDIGGNVTTLTPVTIVVDTTAPTVTLSASPTVISAQSGFNSSVFTLTATDTNSAQGMSYAIKLGETTIKSGTYDGNDITITEAEMVAISAGQGTKSFTAEVTDIAGNVGTSTAQTVTVDLTAPTGSVTANQYYASTSVKVTIAGSDTGGATLSYMKVWLDNSEPSSWSAFAAGDYTFTSVAEGEHTAHIKFKDSVDNASSAFDSSSFIVDTTAPTASPSIPAQSKTKTITVTLNASDTKSGIETSGLDKMKVWQHGTTEPSTWEDYSATKSVTIVGNDGDYTFDVKVKDKAGNESSAFQSNTCRLDQDEPAPTISLFKADGTTALPARVNVTGFVAQIASTDTVQSDPVTYVVSGDFTDSPLEGTLTYDTGKQYQTFSGLNLTSSDGLKTITVTLTDKAGNSNSASATVTLDRTAPEITVSDIDYNRISKQHTVRMSASDASAITGTYNDMMSFKFTANEELQAFKVCVNDSGQTAADAEAIGTTGGSQNMSGGSVAASTAVTCVIMAADFAATDKVNDTDGTYEVIVYGQDVAGTWSAIHTLTV